MSELMRKASKEASDSSISGKLFHISNILRKSREVSHHEAIMRLLSIPFRKSNRAVVFIPTDMKEDRTRLLKPKHVLLSLDKNDTDIYVPSVHDKYAARPKQLEQICLAEFVAWYGVKANKQDEQVEEADFNNDTDLLDTEPLILNHGLGKICKRTRPLIIRYHYISREKDEEHYYHRLLLLYHPWRDEELLKKDDSYKLYFQDVKETVLSTITTYEPFVEEVENVLDNFDPDDLLPEIWDEVSSNIQQDTDDPHNVEHHPDYQFLDPSNLPDEVLEEPRSQTAPPRKYSLTSTYQMPNNEYYELTRSLNDKQRTLFDFMYNWATKSRFRHNPEPFNIFLSGGAGVGKSHLINTIYQGVTRALSRPGQHPDNPTVLVTASTGKAASNINGTTLHAAFALPVRDKTSTFEYKKTGAQKINTLRCLYTNLKLIIADEISMFGAKSLLHLHKSLQDIFEDFKNPFAGISILAVGDLLQLNPVGDQAVFKTPSTGLEALAGSLWTHHFKLYELTDIVRQKGDPTFAQLLSRVRVGSMTTQDIESLETLQHTPTDDFPPDTVHLYFTNNQVSSYNKEKIEPLPNKITIKCQDSKRDTSTNTVPITITSENIHNTGGLPATLTIAKNAKVMVTKNIDIADHLVNGLIGIVKHIDVNQKNPLKGTVFVKFEGDHVGRQARQCSPPHLKHYVPVKPVTVKFNLASQCPVPVERTMYPLVLAFAMTAHKAQGSTYCHLQADLTLPRNMKTVQPGQTYTILSRATSRAGLKLIDFSPAKIKVNAAALDEMKRMQQNAPFLWKHPLSDLDIDNKYHIGYLNIRTLELHAADLRSHKPLHALSAICLTETHVNTNQHHNIDGYNLHGKDTMHGLAMYVKQDSQDFTFQSSDLQIMGRLIHLRASKPLLIVVVYKPPDVNKTTFITQLQKLLTTIPQDIDYVLGGDFNINPLDKSIENLCTNCDIKQWIYEETHCHGDTLDLIFTSNNITTMDITHGTFPLPYTDHHITWISIPNI